MNLTAIFPYDPDTLSQMLSQAKLMEAAIGESVREALLRHKRDGLPVATWRDGKVAWIPADLIQVVESDVTY